MGNSKRGGRVIELMDFSGGLNTASPTNALERNELADIANFDIDTPGVLKTRKGRKRMNESAIATKPVRGLHALKLKTGERFLNAACNGRLWKYNEKTRTWSEVYKKSYSTVSWGPNLLTNGTFDVDTTGWTLNNNGTNTTVARDTTNPRTGAGCLKIVSATPTELITVDPGFEIGTGGNWTNWAKTETNGTITRSATGPHGGTYCALFTSTHHQTASLVLQENTPISINPLDNHRTTIYHQTATGYPPGYIQNAYYDSGNNYLGSSTSDALGAAGAWTAKTYDVGPVNYPATTAKIKTYPKVAGYNTDTMTQKFDDISLVARPRFAETPTSSFVLIDRTIPTQVNIYIKRASSVSYSTITFPVKVAWHDAGDALLRTDTIMTPATNTAYQVFSSTIAAGNAPANATKLKLILDVSGYYNAYDTTASGHGFYIDDISIQQQVIEGTIENLILDEEVHPSFADLMGKTYISGYERNLKLTNGNAIEYLPEYPTSSKYNMVERNRLWLAGDPDNPSRLYYSNYTEGGDADPDTVDVNNFIDIDPDDGDEITGLAPVSGGIAIFKMNSTFLLTGSNENDWYVRKVSNEVGCISHRTLVNVEGNLLFFAGPTKGVFIFNGTTMQKLSSKIDPSIRSLVRPEESCAVYHDNNYYLFCNDQSAYHPYNNTVYVYSIKVGQWTRYTDVFVTSATIMRIGQRSEFIIGTSKDEGKTYKFLDGYDDDGSDISAYFTTADMPFRGNAGEARVRNVMTLAQSGTDDQALTISYASDRATDMTDTTMSLAASGTNKWGVGEWGVAHWENPQMLKSSFVPTTAPAESANHFRLKVAHADNVPVAFYGLAILERERRVMH